MCSLVRGHLLRLRSQRRRDLLKEVVLPWLSGPPFLFLFLFPNVNCLVRLWILFLFAFYLSCLFLVRWLPVAFVVLHPFPFVYHIFSSCPPRPFTHRGRRCISILPDPNNPAFVRKDRRYGHPFFFLNSVPTSLYVSVIYPKPSIRLHILIIPMIL